MLAIFDGMTTGDGEAAVSVVEAAQLGTPNYDADKVSMGKAILIEVGLTSMLVFAIFGTAVDPRAPKIGTCQGKLGIRRQAIGLAPREAARPEAARKVARCELEGVLRLDMDRLIYRV